MTRGFGSGDGFISQSIPQDKNAIVDHYVSPRKPKHGRLMSPESYSKAPWRSTSHNTAMSQDHSPAGANWSTGNPSGVPSTHQPT